MRKRQWQLLASNILLLTRLDMRHEGNDPLNTLNNKGRFIQLSRLNKTKKIKLLLLIDCIQCEFNIKWVCMQWSAASRALIAEAKKKPCDMFYQFRIKYKNNLSAYDVIFWIQVKIKTKQWMKLGHAEIKCICVFFFANVKCTHRRRRRKRNKLPIEIFTSLTRARLSLMLPNTGSYFITKELGLLSSHVDFSHRTCFCITSPSLLNRMRFSHTVSQYENKAVGRSIDNILIGNHICWRFFFLHAIVVERTEHICVSWIYLYLEIFLEANYC